MNLSGKAVAPLARFYKIAPEEILVVHDELDLQPGQLKLKQGGSPAGHNGLNEGHPGPARQRRLLAPAAGHRAPGVRAEVVDYVLRKPSPSTGRRSPGPSRRRCRPSTCCSPAT